jgi:hypothetical protein
MANYVVTCGPKAYSFHDQSTGITICRGEEKELSSRQYLSKKIQNALAAGHLVLVPEKNKTKKYTDAAIRKLDKGLQGQIEKGMEVAKMAKAYTLEEMILIASLHSIEADKEDTVEDLIEAIVEDVTKGE